jgi:hypothetical protein
MTKEMNAERRKFARVLAQDMAFAALRDGFKTVGRIRDISVGGLCFSCFKENSEKISESHHTEVDIFLSKNGFHLRNVPCRVVYDIPNSSDDHGLFVQMNRCGVSFGGLHKTQLDELNFFIKHYTRS